MLFFFERGVLFCVILVFVLCLTVVQLPPGKIHFQFSYIIIIIIKENKICVKQHIWEISGFLPHSISNNVLCMEVKM
jgi:hypothetical protein